MNYLDVFQIGESIHVFATTLRQPVRVASSVVVALVAAVCVCARVWTVDITIDNRRLFVRNRGVMTWVLVPRLMALTKMLTKVF